MQLENTIKGVESYAKSLENKFDDIRKEFHIKIKQTEDWFKVEFSKTEIKMSELKHQHQTVQQNYKEITTTARMMAKREIERIIENLQQDSKRIDLMEMECRRID